MIEKRLSHFFIIFAAQHFLPETPDFTIELCATLVIV